MNDGVAGRIECFANNLLQSGSSMRSRFGGLDDGSAASCDGANQRPDGELEGEVVRPDVLLVNRALVVEVLYTIRRTQLSAPCPWGPS